MSVRLYVGNLPPEVDRVEFEKLFTEAAEILSAKVIRERKTNKCRGFAFVTVATPEIAEELITKLNGYEFGGNVMKLEVAQPREKGAEGTDDEGLELEKSEGSSAAEAVVETPESKPQPKVGAKKRPRTGSREVTSTSSTGEPDPRWASQLQRIKEQLLAAGQP